MLCGFLIEGPEDEIEVGRAGLRRRLVAADVSRPLYGSSHQHRTTELCIRAEEKAREAAAYAANTGIRRGTYMDRISREITEERLHRVLRPHGHLADDYAYHQESDD